MKRHIQGVALALLAASLWAFGCGGSATRAAFAPNWQNDGGRSIAAVHARVGDVPVPEGKGYAVGVTPNGLAGIALDGSGRWSRDRVIDARPAVVGDVVVATGGGQLFALSASTGQELWSVSSDGKSLRGAGDDGQVTVASLGAKNGGGSLFLAVDRSGSVVRKLRPGTEIGVPAVVGGVAFIPWGNQYVSAIELSSGNEIGRLLSRTVTSHARAIGGQLYFGETSLVAFDDNIEKASQHLASRVSLPQRDLPGTPVWHRPGSEVTPRAATAHDKASFYARPEPKKDRLGIDSDRFIATYFRVAVGLAADGGALRWVRTLPKEIVGAGAVRGGFALCDVEGNVHLLGARAGGDAGKVSLGVPLTACVVRGGSYALENPKDAKPLVAQLEEALDVRATSMMAIQQYLLGELSEVPDPEVTRMLIEMASDARTPPAMLSKVRGLLAARRSGAEHMLTALERQFDFLDDVLRPPPVGPLADALAAMNERRAAPLLAMHLNEPTASTDDVKRAAKALETLATADQLPELRTFFTLYRAVAEDENMVQAVLSVASILMRLGGDVERELVTYAAEDPLTKPAIKQGLSVLTKRGS